MENAAKPNLGFKLTDAARLLRRRFEIESRDIPMTTAQLKITARLVHNEGISQSALASLLDLEPMTLSRHVDRMEAAGLVERRPHPTDRRTRQLFSTELSRELLAPMRSRAEAVYEQVQTGLSEKDRELLHGYLSTIIANLCAFGAETNQPNAQSGLEKDGP